MMVATANKRDLLLVEGQYPPVQCSCPFIFPPYSCDRELIYVSIDLALHDATAQM
jgi:hypothetical protein